MLGIKCTVVFFGAGLDISATFYFDISEMRFALSGKTFQCVTNYLELLRVKKGVLVQ